MKTLLLWTILVTWDAPDLHGETHVCVAAANETSALRHGRMAVRRIVKDNVVLGHAVATQDGCHWMPSDD